MLGFIKRQSWFHRKNICIGYVTLHRSPSRERYNISYQTGSKGKSSTQKCWLERDMLVPRRVPYYVTMCCPHFSRHIFDHNMVFYIFECLDCCWCLFLYTIGWVLWGKVPKPLLLTIRWNPNQAKSLWWKTINLAKKNQQLKKTSLSKIWKDEYDESMKAPIAVWSFFLNIFWSRAESTRRKPMKFLLLESPLCSHETKSSIYQTWQGVDLPKVWWFRYLHRWIFVRFSCISYIYIYIYTYIIVDCTRVLYRLYNIYIYCIDVIYSIKYTCY